MKQMMCSGWEYTDKATRSKKEVFLIAPVILVWYQLLPKQ